MKRRTFWIDTDRNGTWGVECDDPAYAEDGWFVCLVGKGDSGRARASDIADVLNMYLPPKKGGTP